jgi:hypothetical protein
MHTHEGRPWGGAERAGVFVLLGAGVDGGHRGEGLIGREITSGQARRAGQFAEQRDPGALLRLQTAALGKLRVHGQRSLLDEPQHLRAGLACQPPEDQAPRRGRYRCR